MPFPRHNPFRFDLRVRVVLSSSRVGFARSEEAARRACAALQDPYVRLSLPSQAEARACIAGFLRTDPLEVVLEELR